MEANEYICNNLCAIYSVVIFINNNKKEKKGEKKKFNKWAKIDEEQNKQIN